MALDSIQTVLTWQTQLSLAAASGNFSLGEAASSLSLSLLNATPLHFIPIYIRTKTSCAIGRDNLRLQ